MAHTKDARCRDRFYVVLDPTRRSSYGSRSQAQVHGCANGPQQHHHPNARIPPSYNNTGLTISLCGPAVDFEKTDQKDDLDGGERIRLAQLGRFYWR
jgi:hypothetical protein